MNDAHRASLGLPEVVHTYQDAHDRHDTDRALSAFAPDARVVDEDHEYRGTDQIRSWLDTAARQFTYTRSLVSAEAIDAETWLVVNHLEGDFPGGVVDLRYEFKLDGETQRVDRAGQRRPRHQLTVSARAGRGVWRSVTEPRRGRR